MAASAAGIFQIIAAVGAAYGTYASVQGQRQAAKGAEAAAEWEAQRQRQEAERERIAASEQARRQRLAAKEQLGQLRARMAKAGVITTTGSPLAALGEAAGRLELQTYDIFDQAQQRYAARRAAAAVAMFEGAQTASSLRTQSTGTILSGVGTMFNYAGNAVQNYIDTRPPAGGTR